ncbi:hypothetical protein Q0N30_19200 [Priestia megaterium]|uniref:cyclic-phosphate processing receiver domain-containing protein n=1 Tax=Priestia megaterium TaxID=1404 RepID=UPI003459956E
MKINVFLDDYRKCPDGHVLAKTIDECIDLLRSFEVEHLSLDHDLLSKTRNGLMLVHFMVKHHLYADRITIHSANHLGSKAMYNCFKEAQKEHKMPNNIKILRCPLPLR